MLVLNVCVCVFDRQYTFAPEPEIMGFFGNFEVSESDEDLWKISTEIKPSQRSQRTT